MGTFTGKNICETYKSILNISNAADNDVLPSAGRCCITDSVNNVSSLEIGQSGQGIKAKGISCFDSSITVGGNVTGTGNLEFGSGTLNSGNATLGAVTASGVLRTTATADATSSGSTTASINTDGGLAVTKAAHIGSTLTVGGDTTISGNLSATGDIVAFYSSDKRLKDDLNRIDNSETIVNGLTGYSFKWNEASGKEDQGIDFGVMAQDLNSVLPELVHERESGYLAVDYIKLIPVLIEEVKRLNQEIEKLKS